MFFIFKIVPLQKALINTSVHFNSIDPSQVSTRCHFSCWHLGGVAENSPGSRKSGSGFFFRSGGPLLRRYERSVLSYASITLLELARSRR